MTTTLEKKEHKTLRIISQAKSDLLCYALLCTVFCSALSKYTSATRIFMSLEKRKKIHRESKRPQKYQEEIKEESQKMK